MTLIEFLQDELETRKQSHLPNPDEDEQGYIAEAQAALAEARALIAERDKLKAHAEAMAESWENQDSDSWDRLADAVDAYRHDYPEER